MRVWVGCLGCYNAGFLVGEWVEAADAGSVTVERIDQLIDTEILEHARQRAHEEHLGTWHPAAAPHEELWVMDLDDCAPFIDGECSPTHAQAVGEALAELDDDELELLRVYVEGIGAQSLAKVDGITDWADAAAEARDKFVGRAESLAAWAENFAEETGLLSMWTRQDNRTFRDVKLTDDDGMSAILRNIDWEDVGEEWTQGMTVVNHDGELWIFTGD